MLVLQVSTDQEITDPIGRPVVHKSAYKQATGDIAF